ncbi:hypothetical protein B0I35DRAFT_474110 [Stachybotrys elegans]|uniref:SigF-like NTF2-like domain-containing protein n=1 Tax=Stachybotrys elegans TaxID=80388 RepID=A0A8K0T656_9HYPO|nr:hypothetical protein B0I35DRAFT_474110 [Stachybotrys elegans]
MDSPVKQIGGVITSLATGTPVEQENTLNAYFLPNASFTHPFCCVPSFSEGTIPLASGLNSRRLILAIYRWYRTLSPRISINVDSAVFDQRSGLLYVSIRQTFALWFVPLYKAPVKLVCVLQLTQRTSWDSSETVGRGSLIEGREPATLAGPGQERAKYYIASQQDLYPITDCIQFLLPGLGPLLWYLWQLYSTFLCTIGSVLLFPILLLLNKESASPKQA